MFDISAQLSVKPGGPALDQALMAGSDSLEVHAFSSILSTELATQALGANMAGAATATVAVAAGGSPILQPDGKILPDGLPVPADRGETADTHANAPSINPFSRILGIRHAPLTASFKTIETTDEHAVKSADAEPESIKASPDEETPLSEIAAAVTIEASPAVSVAPLNLAKSGSAIGSERAEPPAPRAARSAIVPASTTAAMTDHTLTTASVAEASAPPAGPPQPSRARPSASEPRASVVDPAIARVAEAPVGTAAAVSPPLTVAVQASPAATIVAATATIVSAAPVVATEVVLSAIARRSGTAPAESASATPALSAAAKPRNASARAVVEPVATVTAAVVSAEAVAPAAASDGGLTASPTPQPAPLLAEPRPSVVGTAGTLLTPTVPTEAPQDFAALVDRLIAARDGTSPQAVQATVSHGEFGRVSLDFRHDAGALTVGMTSADPGFAPAVLAALATDRAMAGGDLGRQAQPDTPPQAAVQPVIQAQAQQSLQSQTQSQGQQPSQSGSASLQQNASQSETSSQGRSSGQERGGRFQSNPSPARRDDGSSQLRRGTYA